MATEESQDQAGSLDESLLLAHALQRAEIADARIAQYQQKFIDKYNIPQIELIKQLNELRISLIDDEKQLILNQEEIHRNNELIKQSHAQLIELKTELEIENKRVIKLRSKLSREQLTDEDGNKINRIPMIDGEDFRLMMKKYFTSIKLNCLSAKGDLSLDDYWERIIAPNYKLSTEQLRNIRNLFVKDMHFGLSKNENKRKRSSLKMISSSIRSLPNSSDLHGVYYALDWGGSNFRILRVELNGHVRLLNVQEMHPPLKINKDLKTTDDPNKLFDTLALQVRKYMVTCFKQDIINTKIYHIDSEENIHKFPLDTDERYRDDDIGYGDSDSDDDYGQFGGYNSFHRSSRNRNNRNKGNGDDEEEEIDYRYPMGFTFSFPAKQEGINKAYLMEWTKGFNVKGCVGKDICKLMQDSFDKYNIPVRIDAICNDTVGTLLASAFEKYGVRVGLILGTGTNAAYVEPKRKNEIINIEWGAFDKGLPRQPNVDLIMDSYTPNPGKQYAEKMISGEYLGEMVRLLRYYFSIYIIFTVYLNDYCLYIVWMYLEIK